jgi:hypothetical protein
MKKKLVQNHENVAKQLDKDDFCNWIVIEGLKQFSQGKPLGKNMVNFLTYLGVLEYTKK